MPGRKRSQVAVVPVTVVFPSELHAELIRFLEHRPRWVDRCEFIRASVREKLDRDASPPA